LPITDLQTEFGPASEALTQGIRVEVISRHMTENSRPSQGEWIFEYTVRITNTGAEQAQLISRHWVIIDAAGELREVKGPGVVGQQPVLAPGESFKYSSFCPLPTPTGRMHGTYQMLPQNGTIFDAEIAPFGLRARYTVQ
jgi:ApaG protein